MNVEHVHKVTDFLWEVTRSGKMHVPARIYASEKMLKSILEDEAAEQAANVACLPGIVGYSLAMPDIHWGYGFPIGGVAAFDLDEGVVSPGGVGYDINCGVRLMASHLKRQDIADKVDRLMNTLFSTVPTGVGASGAMNVSAHELRKVAVEGAAWAVARGYGTEGDIAHIEAGGCIAEADPDAVSNRAWERAEGQVGTLGSGNHFLEIGCVSDIYDPAAARAFGLALDQVTLFIHCGSRGYGHQICDDYLSTMDRAARKYGIALPDRQLACAPVTSPEGQQYLGAMRCAVNYAFANRQVIAHQARGALERALGMGAGEIRLRTVYEVAHNIAKIETHEVEGKPRQLCVHRKGATRAFPPGHDEVPPDYRAAGQPVLVPGDMGRCSYVLAGTAKAMRDTFGSACHGAGRLMSRKAAIRGAHGRNIIRELADKGIVIKARDRQTIAEEMPDAYKDVSDVVEVCDASGIATRVARIVPLGCIKG